MHRPLRDPERPPRRKLFVYGTLLSGEANHHLLSGARFLGRASTLPAFDLVDLGEYPALVPGGATSVSGEVYAVSRGMLAILDDFEGHPSFYARTRIGLSDGRFAGAYLLRPERAVSYPRIASGDWRRAGRS